MMRTTRRFAVCRAARLKPCRGRAADGLLVELSLDGCRISNIGNTARFIVGEAARLEIDGFDPFEAEVRWSKDGFVGVYFARSLNAALLDTLLKTCRLPAAAA
jgi:hypothetical protein